LLAARRRREALQNRADQLDWERQRKEERSSPTNRVSREGREALAVLRSTPEKDAAKKAYRRAHYGRKKARLKNGGRADPFADVGARGQAPPEASRVRTKGNVQRTTT